MKICNDKKLCTGCGMCLNICPKHAITMQKDKHGFVYPFIDKAKCIDCNMCRLICPSNSEKDGIQNTTHVYAAWNKNKKVRKNSSSGGIFTLLAEHVINDGGVVAGVCWGANNRPEHILIENLNDLYKLQGSKYVQSFTGNIYSEVKKKLLENKKVLFSGTPCQVCALQSFLKRKYDNIYYIDVICHGVPSQDIFDRYLEERVSENQSKINKIYFRYKNPYWDYSNVRIEFENGNIYMKKTIEDPYFNLFNIGYSLRESCHSCQYTNLHRYGDITLADFWGYKANSFKMRGYLKGTSCIMINSKKGESMFNWIKQKIIFEKGDLDFVVKNQVSLSKSFNPINNDVDKFWRDYEDGMSVEYLDKKYVTDPFVQPNLMWLRRIKYKYWWVFKRK